MFELRDAPEAEADLLRLYEFLVERIETAERLGVAGDAIVAIRSGLQGLPRHPFPYRKHHDDPLLRELLIPFGASGDVALHRIVDARPVLIVALRHQIEADYH